VLGGDGRYTTARPCRPCCAWRPRTAARVLLGQGGILSTPAVSCVIRKHGAQRRHRAVGQP
jgi:phosphoglucomutase